MGPISGRFTENWRRNNTFCFGDGSVLSSDGKNQRSPGDGSDERLCAAGAHSRLVPGPPVYGSVSLWALCNPRRAKSRPVSVLFSAHRGLLPSKFEGIYILTHTAWCVPTCLVRRWSDCRQQLPSRPGSARVGGVRTAQTLLNFCPGRPPWAGARRMQGLVFGAAG